MKRYEHYCSLDGGGIGQPEEVAEGDWVRYEDAIAAVAAERERIRRALQDMQAACTHHNYYAHALVATGLAPNVNWTAHPAA